MAATPVAVVQTHHRAYLTLRTQAQTQLGQAWDRFADLNDRALATYLDVAVPLAVAARTRSAELLGAYLSTLVAQQFDETPHAGIDPATIAEAVRGGVPLDEVYARAVITARTLVGDGAPVSEAMRIARDRAVTTIDTDAMLANRDATTAYLSNEPRIIGYERVLTGGKVCALCVTASTQRYHTDRLMPIHDHCDCDVAPIFAGERPAGQIINRGLLRDVKNFTGEKYHSRQQLTHVGGWVDDTGRVHFGTDIPDDARTVLPASSVREHGELGPVLTDRADVFTGPRDI